MGKMPKEATLLEMRAGPGCLAILLSVGDGSVQVEFDLGPATVHALRHVGALHGHVEGCDARVEVHVDLLLRCLGSLGVLALAVVVRTDEPPGFYLRLLRPCAGEIHMDLNVLDAVCLLLSRRLPVQVERHATMNWDVALRGLLDQGQRRQA